MEKFSWSGAFALQKHVSSIDTLSLEQMTEADWLILDFPALRPKAREKIVRQIVEGDLSGFVRVNYDMHKRSHGGKPTYYYPTGQGEPLPVPEDEGGEIPGGFPGDFDDEDVEEFPGFDGPYNRMVEFSPSVTIPVAAFVYNAMREDQSEPQPETEPSWDTWPNWAVVLYLLTLLYSIQDAALMRVAEQYGTDISGLSREQAVVAIVNAI